MMYIFRNDFPLKNGSVIRKGDAVFIDNPNESNEVTEAVTADKEKADKKVTKSPKE